MTAPALPQAVRTLRKQPAPPGIYASKYTPELAVEICNRLASGESLRSICRADVTMPTEKTVWNWMRSHPDFRAARDAAVLFARRERRERHALAALTRRYASKVDGRAWKRGWSCYSDEVADALCRRLCVGEPLYKTCRLPDMPSLGTVYTWLRTRPDFLRLYRQAKAAAFMAVMDEAMEHARERETEAASMRELARLEKAGFRRCAWLAPTVYGEGIYRPLPSDDWL